MNAKTKSCPIIFREDEVRAILDGRKKVFRRPVEPQPEAGTEYPYHVGEGRNRKARRCPYGKPGDLLWVQECWGVSHRGDATPGGHPYDPTTLYRATDYAPEGDEAERQWESFRWREAVEMSSRFSRITLRVTGTRIERLHDINDEGAWSEGAEDERSGIGEGVNHVSGFVRLWDSQHAAKGFGWDTNPWVWVVEFERVEGNA